MKKLILISLLFGLLTMMSCTPKYESVVPIAPVSLEDNVKIDSTQDFYIATQGKYCETIYVIDKATNVVVYQASNIPFKVQDDAEGFNSLFLFILIVAIVLVVIGAIVTLCNQ